MDKECFCVAILENHEKTEAARNVFAHSENTNVSISFLCKPGTDKQAIQSIECSSIGTISIDGSLGDVLALHRCEPSGEFTALFDLLQHIGVPGNRHENYEKILCEGRTLMILQGPEDDLRIGCDALSPLCREKPILYFR